MWSGLSVMLSAVVLLSLVHQHGAAAAPASSDITERYLDREYALELYGLLQNYLNEGGRMNAFSRGIPTAKRNSEIINSLLALQKNMADVGR